MTRDGSEIGCPRSRNRLDSCFRRLQYSVAVTDITLIQAMKFLKGEDGTLIGVVKKPATDRGPEEISRWIWHLDHLHQIGGDGGVKPRDNALVDLEPVSVVPHGLRIDSAIDMVEKPELAEGGIEEGCPNGEGGVAAVEDDGNVGANVHVLQSGCGDGV